uniref:hypothetical protein n=1 Tax=Variovorax sp. BK018 TaxID=3450241 RepID=UPI004039F758
MFDQLASAGSMSKAAAALEDTISECLAGNVVSIRVSRLKQQRGLGAPVGVVGAEFDVSARPA